MIQTIGNELDVLEVRGVHGHTILIHRKSIVCLLGFVEPKAMGGPELTYGLLSVKNTGPDGNDDYALNVTNYEKALKFMRGK